jgi:hypothetical protein
MATTKRTQFHIFLVMAIYLSMASLGPTLLGHEQGAPPDIEAVQSLLEGLSAPDYRVRRESFLRLCDRSLNIDGWLAKEAKTEDRYRAAIALWLSRLRQSNGTPMERLTMLQDLESLKKADVRVLDRYVSEGRWEQLVELFGLLEPLARRELLGEENRTEWLIDQAWKSHNELYIPKILNLTLQPIERVHVNRWWKKLGMPSDWHVDEPDNLPSVKIAKLEAEGKVDEAVEVAKKSRTVNYIEGLLIRSGRWDEWLALDTRRIPVLGSQHHYQQKTALLVTLGRMDEAEKTLDQSQRPVGAENLAVGDALLSLALGRTDEFETYVSSLSKSDAFAIWRARGDVQDAFESIGLNDHSIDSVKDWVRQKGYIEPKSPDDDETVQALALIDYADFFFQLGLREQGQFLDAFVVEDIKTQEKTKGYSAWIPLFQQWRLRNDRSKAIEYWKDYLIRDSKRAKSQLAWNSKLDQEDSTSPFSLFYPEFPRAASEIYEYLYGLAFQTELERALANQADSDNAEIAERIIPKVIEQLDDLAFGRMPKGWKQEQRLQGMRQFVISKTKASGASTFNIALELAELFDALGDPQLAFETLDVLSDDKQVSQAKAKYLIKLGEMETASNLLLDEFSENSTDLALMLQCEDSLEAAGRFSELDRVRIQGLSSVSNKRVDVAERSLFGLPVRREVQMVLEQHWLRNDDFYSAFCLSHQYGEAAKEDLTHANAASRFARIDTIGRVKHLWANDKFEFGRLQVLFTHGFQSFVLAAIADQNRELADTLYRVVHRCSPQDIDFPIAVIPFAEKAFGREFADRWFDLYFQPMLRHATDFPHDTLIGNNTAWLAASCNRELETAKKLASRVVASEPSPTYLDTLAEVEYRLGNVENAIELSEKCRLLEPKEKQHRRQVKRFRAGNP